MSGHRLAPPAEALRLAAERQIAGLRSGPASSPGQRRPITTVESTVLHDLQIRATVEGHGFIADEPMGKGGHDAGPAPMRYFLAGVMMCHQVWCIKSAAVREVPLDRLSGAITAYGASAPADDGDVARTIDRIDYTVSIDSTAPSSLVCEISDEATRLCPAFGTVAAGAVVRLAVHHNGTAVAERTYGRAAP